MKKGLRIATTVVLLTAVVFSLVGCANLGKKKAFIEYTSSLQGDAEKLQSVSEAMESVNKDVNKGNLTGAKAALQSKINPALVELSNNAATRHSGITDPEISKMDTYYVNYTKHMSDGMAMLLDGINTTDQAKLNAAMTEMNTAMLQLQEYANEMQSFMNRYGIKDDGSVAAFQQAFGN